jgi:hypothetical protein
MILIVIHFCKTDKILTEDLYSYLGNRINGFNWRRVVAFVRFMDLTITFEMTAMIVVPILSPRIPPYVGYFFCQLAEYGKDPCGMGDLVLEDLLSFTLLNIKTVIRVVSGCICILVFIPGMWNANQMFTYEVLANLLFQNESVNHLKEMVRNSRALSHHHLIMRGYNQLGVINIAFNKLFRRDFFAIVIVGAVGAVVSSGFFLLTSYHVHELALILLAFITFMEYFIVTMIFVVASKVWNASADFKFAWQSNEQFSRNRLTRRIGRSFRNMKIQVGSSNFVERNTPFVFISFCIEQTISLVLLSTV